MASRLLLAVTMVLVVVMPWTEYFCHFDQFLRGGQDLEIGLLTVASFLCLALVLLEHGRTGVTLLLRVCRWMTAIVPRPTPGLPGSLLGLIAAAHAAPLPSPALALYSLPIQV